jgi:hypothetical protein
MLQFHWTSVVSDLMTLNECVHAGAAMVKWMQDWVDEGLARR